MYENLRRSNFEKMTKCLLPKHGEIERKNVKRWSFHPALIRVIENSLTIATIRFQLVTPAENKYEFRVGVHVISRRILIAITFKIF